MGFAPYHLINATANLSSSTNVALRERRSRAACFPNTGVGRHLLATRKHRTGALAKIRSISQTGHGCLRRGTSVVPYGARLNSPL